VTGRRTLFRGAYTHGVGLRDYDAMPDGQHFLMVRGTEAPSMLIAVHNVFDSLVYAGRRP